MGDEKSQKGSEELMDALDKACRIGGKHNAVLMVYKKAS
jgi:hypothetical protein